MGSIDGGFELKGDKDVKKEIKKTSQFDLDFRKNICFQKN
jgi:hypothetical protein